MSENGKRKGKRKRICSGRSARSKTFTTYWCGINTQYGIVMPGCVRTRKGKSLRQLCKLIIQVRGLHHQYITSVYNSSLVRMGRRVSLSFYYYRSHVGGTSMCDMTKEFEWRKDLSQNMSTSAFSAGDRVPSAYIRRSCVFMCFEIWWLKYICFKRLSRIRSKWNFFWFAWS